MSHLLKKEARSFLSVPELMTKTLLVASRYTLSLFSPLVSCCHGDGGH